MRFSCVVLVLKVYPLEIVKFFPCKKRVFEVTSNYCLSGKRNSNFDELFPIIIHLESGWFWNPMIGKELWYCKLGSQTHGGFCILEEVARVGSFIIGLSRLGICMYSFCRHGKTLQETVQCVISLYHIWSIRIIYIGCIGFFGQYLLHWLFLLYLRYWQ